MCEVLQTLQEHTKPVCGLFPSESDRLHVGSDADISGATAMYEAHIMSDWLQTHQEQRTSKLMHEDKS
jgi:hypothetical protein